MLLKGGGPILREGMEDVRLPHFSLDSSEELRIFMSRKVRESDGGKSFLEYLNQKGMNVTILDSYPNKFCAIAEGRACMYLRLGPTSEWDTAAGEVLSKRNWRAYCNQSVRMEVPPFSTIRKIHQTLILSLRERD